MRVVRDDERGLVAWLPAASEVLVPVPPLDGKGLRERTPAERVVLEYEMHVARPWHPADRARREALVALVLLERRRWVRGALREPRVVHRRRSPASPAHTRDLTLDLWIEGADVWLKDEDELEAVIEGGRLSAEQGDVIRAIGERAAYELGHLRSWPLDEDWESYRPPAEWDEPLALPDLPSVLEARPGVTVAAATRMRQSHER